VPNWRWEDTTIDPYALRIAGWLASHADGYCQDNVTRNSIARRTGVSAGKVTTALAALAELGIVAVETIEVPQSQGGKRLRVTFDFDVWERRPRSPGDQAPGHMTTGPRSRHDQAPGHVVTASKDAPVGEQQGDAPAAPTPADEARRIATDYWEWVREQTGKVPVGIGFMALAKLVEPFIAAGYTAGAVKQTLADMYRAGRTLTRQQIETHLDGRADRGRPARVAPGRVDDDRTGVGGVVVP